jgi:hypothetical protein
MALWAETSSAPLPIGAETLARPHLRQDGSTSERRSRWRPCLHLRGGQESAGEWHGKDWEVEGFVKDVAMWGRGLYSRAMDVIAHSAPTGMIKQIISMSITDTEIIRLPAEPGDR